MAFIVSAQMPLKTIQSMPLRVQGILNWAQMGMTRCDDGFNFIVQNIF